MKAAQRFSLLILVFVVLLGGSPTYAQQMIPQKLTFIPQWTPQSQFAGYYVALAKGFYLKQGLDVTILRGGPDRPCCELLEKGVADFGTLFLSYGIQKHAQGSKLVNIGQLIQRSSLMLVARKTAGIHTPQDLNGKKVGLWGADFQVQAKAFFKLHHLSVTIVPQSATVNLFLRGGVEVASAMWYNEYHTILNAGIDATELTTFFLADHGVNFPEDGIYCMLDTFRNNPQSCCRFVRASLEGWQYALAHTEEALDIVMKYVDEANIATDRAHQKWMLERMRDVILPPGVEIPMGVLRPEDFARVAQELAANGIIDRVPNFDDFAMDCELANEQARPGV
jgi:NitT/TauT family transport system substrate-binding protein